MKILKMTVRMFINPATMIFTMTVIILMILKIIIMITITKRKNIEKDEER